MWSKILGHAQQVAQLQHIAARQRIAGAYLFAGPRGVGKQRVALTFIAQLLCESEHAPCEQCAICTRIMQQQHPDVFGIGPDDSKATPIIAIDQIRKLQQRIQLHSLEGQYKFILIDQAETMNLAAANAALKMLEEPPAHTHFILLSSQPDRLLTTIRSRCQTVHFHPLPHQHIVKHLQAQGMELPEATQRSVLADGSLGKALSYPIEIFSETVRDLYQVLQSTDQREVLTTAERWSSDQKLLGERLHIGCILWRDALAQRCGSAERAQLPATGSLLEQLTKRSPRRLHQELCQLLSNAQSSAETTFNKQLSCEALLFQLHERSV